MKEALLDREDCNVVLVDWSEGAKWAKRLVGVQIATLIKFLISSYSGSSDWAD